MARSKLSQAFNPLKSFNLLKTQEDYRGNNKILPPATSKMSVSEIVVSSGSRSRPALAPTTLASALRPDGLLLP